jgi:hypothetical protein
MLRAVLKNGQIKPLDPLPAEWTDGEELVVEQARKPDLTPDEIDRWAKEMDALCANSDPEDEARVQAAIEEQRRQGKEWMRRRMGLPE